MIYYYKTLGVETGCVRPSFHNGSWGMVTRRERTADHGFCGIILYSHDQSGAKTFGCNDDR